VKGRFLVTNDLIPDRTDYGDQILDIDQLKNEPLEQFRKWLAQAISTGVPEPNAMCLSTIDSEGFPDSRMVLLKGLEKDALRFYTNYESRKGMQLKATQKGSLVFWWEPLKRQVRFVGKVERLSAEVSDRYFESRPRDSQLGAWASSQSQVIESRHALEERLSDIAERFPAEVPRPPHWGGFRLIPHRAEFWQGRSSRLHDRFLFTQEASGWTARRLMP
jgi:pyridoxamine 5'-phosphate oxidase